MPHTDEMALEPSTQCRACGCTEEEPCDDPVTGLPCYWIEHNLCSCCSEFAASDGEEQDGPLVALYSEGEMNREIAARRAAGGLQ